MIAVLHYAILATIVLSSSPANAAFVISPDEICAPTDDPCDDGNDADSDGCDKNCQFEP